MTAEGLKNLKKVLHKAIELQVDAILVMATLQSIYCDEEDGLDQDTEKYLCYADTTAKGLLDYATSTTNNIQKAYGIEKDIAKLEKQLNNIQDNDEAETGGAQEVGA